MNRRHALQSLPAMLSVLGTGFPDPANAKAGGQRKCVPNPLGKTTLGLGPAISAVDLLKPDVFPNSSFGMAVETVEDNTIARVLTTGGEFLLNKSTDTIECRQRIPRLRTAAVLKLLPKSLTWLRLTHRTSGAAIFSGGETVVRINGDSILMLSVGHSGDLTAELRFSPNYVAAMRGNYNFLDPDGGISFFENGCCPGSRMRPAYGRPMVTWPWKTANVFWISISPPKRYGWESSFRNRVIWHHSRRNAYPSDEDICRWSKYGNILLLQSEIALWKNWQLAFEPRKGLEEWRRVLGTAHKQGMRVMVYCSPLYFLKGTPIENLANSNRAYPSFGPGRGVGDNEPLFLAAIGRMIKELHPDGLYFDGMYPSPEALATEYHLTRSARDMVSDNGLLEFHASTDALGGGHDGPYCPALHAYYDFILKGEGDDERVGDPDWDRYILSTYNVSNAIGVADLRTNNESEKMIDALLRVNVRLHLKVGAPGTIDPTVSFFTHYFPRLTPSLKEQIAKGLRRRVDGS